MKALMIQSGGQVNQNILMAGESLASDWLVEVR